MARIIFSGQFGQTSQTCHLNQSDRSRKVCQIVNWIAPLRRSRLDDRNAYMECPIWSPDEKVMPSGRPAPRSDRSDRSRGGLTGPETGQTGLKRPIRVRSCILTRVQTSPPYIYEGIWPIEGNPNRFNNSYPTFYLQTLAFPTPSGVLRSFLQRSRML